MKSAVLIILCIQAFYIYPQTPEITYLKAYAEGDETNLPVLSDDGNTQFTIEFDVETDFIPALSIVFRFCDRNWIPYNNLFLISTGKNVFYDLDFKTLPSTVAAARYHFKKSFPDPDGTVDFPFSGKWRFYITDSFDTSIVYESGKFYVIHEELALQTTIQRELLENKVYFPTDLAKVLNITTSFVLPDELHPSFVLHMEIVENHKVLYPYIVDRSFNTNTRQFYWNGARNFSFTIRDIRPGNENRQTDIRNYNKFIGEHLMAHFDGLEYSRFFKQAKKDLNGGSILLEFNDEYATYHDVAFSIRPPDEITGSIFLVGAFNAWTLSPLYEMKQQGGIYSITTTLKRGIYDYQYVPADIINNKIVNENWYILEGNSWETVNDYYIFIYYNEQQFGGFDKIIGYLKVQSK